MKNVFTDNPKEQCQIGKEIVNEKGDIYDVKTVLKLYNVVRSNMPDASDEELQSMFYRSIYDYWIYGNNVGEEFYYRFYLKSHEEKSAYITYNNRWPYYAHLNETKDIHYLDRKYHTYQELKDYYKRDLIQIVDEFDYDAFSAFVDKHKTFVVKPQDLSLATGVYKYEIRGG